MHYKYQKRQVLGKRLKVPKFILKVVFNFMTDKDVQDKQHLNQ